MRSLRGADQRPASTPSLAAWLPGCLAAGGWQRQRQRHWALGLVTNVQDTLHFAEFGVVWMLFLVGLELEPQRLWHLRRPIFGWGSAQVLGCATILTAVAMVFGVGWKIALVAGLALSSTAIALQAIGARNLMLTSSGQAGFSILLFQDVAAIPILALLPLLGAVSLRNDAVTQSGLALASY